MSQIDLSFLDLLEEKPPLPAAAIILKPETGLEKKENSSSGGWKKGFLASKSPEAASPSPASTTNKHENIAASSSPDLSPDRSAPLLEGNDTLMGKASEEKSVMAAGMSTKGVVETAGNTVKPMKAPGTKKSFISQRPHVIE